MSITRTRPPLPYRAVGVLLIVLMACSVGFAQDDASNNDLRRENDQLKNRIARLEAKLTQAEHRIESLKREAEQLRQQLGEDSSGGNGSGPGDSGAGSGPSMEEAPADPMACPESLLNALREDLAGQPFFANATSDRQGYLRQLARWTNRVEREFRDTVNWVIEIDGVEKQGSRFSQVTFRVINPLSGAAIGSRSSTRLPSRHAEKFEGAMDARWEIEAMFHASPSVVPDRDGSDTEGAQPMVGPYAEFGYQLSIKNSKEAG